MRIAAALIVTLLAFPVSAQEAEPPRPRERPEATEAAPIVPLPRTRPETMEEPVAEPTREPETAPAAPPAATRPPWIDPQWPEGEPQVAAPIPEPPAPPRVYQSACPAVLLGRVEATALPPIEEGQCGTQSPLSVTGVLANGRMVPLSGGIETDCGMASALPAWLEAVDSYLMARENTRIAELVIGTSYMCRNVNNGASGNLSFHAFANALDIVGFRLEDERFVTVLDDWDDALSPGGRLLRFAHGAACANFTTVLGPEANAQHADHFHFDLGCHGKTCTARICE
jgi:hypothetical protein